MSLIHIALKQGATLFGAGTVFQVPDTVITKEVDGLPKQFYQIPDDAMGRIVLVETKDVIHCTDEMLKGGIPGHGRCNCTKIELWGEGSQKFTDDFAFRNISIEDQYGAWLLKWLVSRKSNASTKSSVFNKVTSDTVALEAIPLALDYEELSIDPQTYEQKKRKMNGLHYLWDLSVLKPGFYTAQVKLDEISMGTIHFIKHIPIKVDVTDPRKTDDVNELAFAEEIWNGALDIMLAWGPAMNVPFQTRLLERYPDLTWAQANYLEKICQEASSFAWRMYEQEAQQAISVSEAMKTISSKYPWIDSERQSRLRNQGQYYARK